jgi:DNA-directed RNA polymerase subunit RPC12/RpoP
MTQRPQGAGQEQGANRKKRVRLSCPSCGFRVGDSPPHIRMSIRLTEDDPMQLADLYIKCGRCKSEIAARKIE